MLQDSSLLPCGSSGIWQVSQPLPRSCLPVFPCCLTSGVSANATSQKEPPLSYFIPIISSLGFPEHEVTKLFIDLCFSLFLHQTIRPHGQGFGHLDYMVNPCLREYLAFTGHSVNIFLLLLFLAIPKKTTQNISASNIFINFHFSFVCSFPNASNYLSTPPYPQPYTQS